MSNLKAYLAEKYMSGPKAEAILSKVAPQKKKKRKTAAPASSSASGGARIVDEDGGWVDQPQDETEDLEEAIIEKDRGFKKRKVEQKVSETSGGWAMIQESIKQEEEQELEDEKPLIKQFAGGLVATKDLKKEIAQMQETVYRDASGRKIDAKAERAEAARLKREREEREAKKMEWGKGLVQKDEEEKRRQEIEKQKSTAFARRADDKELNEELKAKELWNDPAAAFLSKKKSKGPRKPEYNGPPPPPNRFGIKPGYRWDGVDRSNGFEKKLFQSINNRTRQTTEYYAWSVDDM
ncbi:Pre-mRNA-splicing factor of RES complex-domain-containing protein [Amanita rubescens]|nr:Pre-mRNA-splicing factor of RES complex-domain-containing protein [Amanita rubescens]